MAKRTCEFCNALEGDSINGSSYVTIISYEDHLHCGVCFSEKGRRNNKRYFL